MHLTTQIIRSLLDGELPEKEHAEAQQHLSGCEMCRALYSEEETRRNRVRSALDSIAPESEANAEAALGRFRMKQTQQRAPLPGWIRPVAAAAAAVVLVVVCLSVPAVRVWASNFLSLFRVQQVSIVQIDPAGFRAMQQNFFNHDMQPRVEQLFSDSMQIRKNGEQREVSTVEEAGRFAGFGVRLPANLGAPSRIIVGPSSDISFVLDIPRLQSLLEEAGRPDVRLPESVNGQMVSAHIPPSVAAFFGKCPDPKSKDEQDHDRSQFPDCKMLVQLPGPTVAAPPDFDIKGLSSTMMQILGMPADQARAWSESIDWTSTLVIPVPRSPRMKISQIEVDGAQGTLITVPERRESPAAYNVFWVRDGILYTFLGQGKSEDALQILNTM